VDFEPGRATIEFERNQCSHSVVYVHVDGARVTAYDVSVVDPDPRDNVGFNACTEVGGDCGGPCERRTLQVDARRDSELRGEGRIDRPRPSDLSTRP
jgi:hypothetical protein